MTFGAKRWHVVVVAAAGMIAIAAAGSTLTDLGPWYQSLKEPAWKPPDAAFGLIWTTIFTFATASAVFAWTETDNRRLRRSIVALFALNGALNVLWSVLFFQMHRPDFAIVELAFLWLSLIVLIIVNARHSWRASVLLVPYLIWVSIAGVLNFDVVRLNGPFA